MKFSEWKTLYQKWIDGIECELGIPVPALEEFRARINEAAPFAGRRKNFEDEFEAFLNNQSFLRKATSRYLGKRAAQAIESATALLQRAQLALPTDETMEDEPAEEERTNDETTETAQLAVIDVWDAIRGAEQVLPGHAAPKGKRDPRWAAITAVGDFIEEEPDAIWPFIVRWCSSTHKGLRDAISTGLLEELLEYYFSRFFPRVEETVRANATFAETFLACWKLGQAAEEDNAQRFEALQAECRKGRPQT